MPESERPPEMGLERDLRDLGSRIEYPPTPDLARAVRHRLDAQEGAHTPARGPWRFPLSPRWAVPAAALVLILFVALSPAVRGSLSDLFSSGQAASSGAGGGAEAGGSASRPESGGSGGRSDRETGVAPQAARLGGEDAPGGDGPAGDVPAAGASGSAVAAGSASAAAVGCPAPYLKVDPARASPGAPFRLRGNNLTSGCERIRPAKGIRIDFRQDGETWRLATVDADRDLSFETGLRVPAGARPGRATVRATIRPGESVEKRFVVLR